MPTKKGQRTAGRLENESKNRCNHAKRSQKPANHVARKHSPRGEVNIVRHDKTKRNAVSVCEQHKRDRELEALAVVVAVNDNADKVPTSVPPAKVKNLKDVSIEEASHRLQAKITQISCCQSAVGGGKPSSCFTQLSPEAIQAVLNEIDLDNSDLASIIAATRALEQYANAYPQSVATIVQLGGLQVLVHVIVGCKNEWVHEAACASLMAMILKYSQCRNSVIAAGGIQAALLVMKTHQESSSLQIVGCRILKELAANNPRAQDLIATASGVETVLAAMAQHSSVGILQAVGCGVLRNVSAGNSTHQSHIANLGGVQQVLHSMVQSSGDATVQWAGCWAIFCLTVRNNNVQTEFRRHGAVDAVMRSMRQHRSIPKLQEAGCWALSELSAVNDVKMDLAVRAQAVSRTMEDHRLNEQVAKAGRAALARFGSYDRKPMIAASSNKKRRVGSLPTIHE